MKPGKPPIVPHRLNIKVAFICQYFYPEQYLTTPAALALKKLGCSVQVLSAVPNYGQNYFFEGYSNSLRRSEVWEGIVINRAWTVARGRRKITLFLNFLIFPVTAIWTCLQRIKPRPDVSLVVLPSPLFQAVAAIFMKKFWGVPCVYWVQDVWPDTVIELLKIRNNFLRKVLTLSCRWIYRQADAVLVQSRAFGPLMEGLGVKRSRIEYLPNTARDIYKKINPSDASNEGKLFPDSGFKIVFAGNIGESQDFTTILAAAESLSFRKDIFWIILGSGRDLDSTKKTAERLGIEHQVRFLGRFPEERMPRFFAHADALLVSLKDSPIFNSTIPSKLQSYMACGKPIIANVGGEAALLVSESGAGVVSAPGHPADLAAAVLKLVVMSEVEREAMGERALNFFKNNFAPEKIYTQLKDFVVSTAASARPSS